MIRKINSVSVITSVFICGLANAQLCQDSKVIDAMTLKVPSIESMYAEIEGSKSSPTDGSFLGSSRKVEFKFTSPSGQQQTNPAHQVGIVFDKKMIVSVGSAATPDVVNLTYNSINADVSSYEGIRFQLSAAERLLPGRELKMRISLEFTGPSTITTSREVKLDRNTSDADRLDYKGMMPFASFPGLLGVNLSQYRLKEATFTFTSNQRSLNYFVSPFYLHCASDTIPVKYVYFKGQAEAGKNILAWRTGSEQNNHRFEVYRSKGNGGEDELAGTVYPVTPNSDQGAEYSFEDTHPDALGGTVIYRLVQIDTDGTKHFSQFVSISRASDRSGTERNLEMSSIFNPSTRTLTVKSNEKARFAVYDSNGRVIARPLKYAVTTQAIELGNQKSGVYYLKGWSESGRQSSEALWLNF